MSVYPGKGCKNNPGECDQQQQLQVMSVRKPSRPASSIVNLRALKKIHPGSWGSQVASQCPFQMLIHNDWHLLLPPRSVGHLIGGVLIRMLAGSWVMICYKEENSSHNKGRQVSQSPHVCIEQRPAIHMCVFKPLSVPPLLISHRPESATWLDTELRVEQFMDEIRPRLVTWII